MEKSVTYSPVNTVSVMTGIKPGLQTLVREKKIFDEISAPQKKKKKKRFDSTHIQTAQFHFQH